MVRFRSFSIGQKLLLSYGLIGLLMIALGGFSGYLLHRLNQQINGLTEQVEPSLIAILKTDVNISDFRQIQLRQTGFATKEEREQFRLDLKALQVKIKDQFSLLNHLLDLPQEQAGLKAFEMQWQQYGAFQDEFQSMLDEGNNSDARDFMLEEGLPKFQKIKSTIADLEQALNQRNQETAVVAKQKFDESVFQISGMVLLVLVLMVASALRLIAQIRKPLQRLATQAQQIAAGDLSARLDMKFFQQDEIGLLAKMFSDMQSSLHDLIEGISDTVHHMNLQVENGRKTASDSAISIRTQEQELTSLAAAMNEMSATVANVAEHTVQTAQEANIAATEAKVGGEVVEKSIASIQSVSSDVDCTTEIIRQLAGDSGKISLVLDVIRGIAEQTNLLALNAAIEAARAGEQGRGFAVVADEVRSLAQRTQQSTQEIQTIIQSLQSRSDEAVRAMGHSSILVQDCVSEAQLAGNRISAIATSVQQIADMTHQIASATEQQQSVADELNQNLDAIHQSVAVVATGAQKTASASDLLADLTQQLRQMTLRFQI